MAKQTVDYLKNSNRDFNNVLDSYVNISDSSLSTTAGTGITTATGVVYANSAVKTGGIYKTEILIDLTGLRSTAANDIIGVNGTALVCHIGQITAGRNGTILAGQMTTFEAPAGGDPDIDLYYATEGTGVEDGAIGDLTETQLINAGDHSIGDVHVFAAGVVPAANSYLYLVAASATDADYTAGRLLIEMWGYDA